VGQRSPGRCVKRTSAPTSITTAVAFTNVPQFRIGLPSDLASRRRLHGKKLALAHWNEAGRKFGISRHQRDEGSHLLHVRRRVIHDQQASRAQNSTQVWPPGGILQAFGIEKNQVVCALITSLQKAVLPFGSLLSLRRAFEERGLPAPRITLVSDLVMFKLRAVAGSDLVGVTVKANVPTAAAQYRLKILPVKGLDWVRPVAVAYRKDAYLSPAARRFIEILKATARGISRTPA
jgi:hypothetical protein